MAPKSRGGKPRRDDTAVKIDRTVADKARLVASRRGLTVAEYLTDLVRAPVERDFIATVKEMEAGTPSAESRPKSPPESGGGKPG